MFEAPTLLKNPHIQTLYATLFRRDKLKNLEYEEFKLSDGDFVEIVWMNKKPKEPKKIVVLFHGLAGSINSPYIVGQMNTLQKEGYSAVLMHFRGCGTKANLKPYAYHSGKTDDAKEFIEYLQKEYPKSDIYAIGYSIGANMLLKLLGEWGSSSPLKKAIAISPPLKLNICADTINKGFARVYQSYLLKELKNTLLRKYEKFNMQKILGIDKTRVKRVKTIREFDNLYVAKIFGFGTANNYYKKASSCQYLKHIKTQTLIIHAKDDPFMTPDVLPKSDELSSSIMLELSDNGGHIGFVTGSFIKPKYWLESRVGRFLIN